MNLVYLLLILETNGGFGPIFVYEVGRYWPQECGAKGQEIVDRTKREYGNDTLLYMCSVNRDEFAGAPTFSPVDLGLAEKPDHEKIIDQV